jgi:hypothetical protein
MYLFNVGVTDAKGLHHPTVFALQLGKGYLRNKVVGAVWQNAHEWVRHNLSAITSTLLNAARPFDVKLELNVPEICYEPSKGVVLLGCNWQESFGTLGSVTHAFPQVQHPDVSFKRDPLQRGYFKGVADGDLVMFTGVADGMGGGAARDNRGTAKVSSDACSFHKGKRIGAMFITFLRETQLLRKKKGVKEWDALHPLGYLLNGSPGSVYQREFGDFLDDVMQHDALPVTQGCWHYVHEKCRAMGVSEEDLRHLDLHHHPATGMQGHHGRSSQTYEMAAGASEQPHPLESVVNGQRHMAEKGVVSSANNLESRINKRFKKAAGSAHPMVTLVPILIEEASVVCSECAAEHQYSTLPDFLGQCDSTSSDGPTAGRWGKDPTGRNFRAMFKEAMNIAYAWRDPKDTTDVKVQYYRAPGPKGATATYIIASKETMRVAHLMVRRNAAKAERERSRSVNTLHKAVQVLRDSWLEYMDNPREYVSTLEHEIQAWSLAQARDHMQDDKAFCKGSRHGAWKGKATAGQTQAMLDKEMRFNNQAFRRIIPRAFLSRAASDTHVREPWRKQLLTDPWRTDLGFFECLHCNQYSKTKYCVHVAAVTMIEEVLAGVPGCMDPNGVGTRGNHHYRTPQGLADKYGAKVAMSSPEKAAAEIQSPVKSKVRFSSQSPSRRANYAQKVSHANRKRAWDLA